MVRPPPLAPPPSLTTVVPPVRADGTSVTMPDVDDTAPDPSASSCNQFNHSGVTVPVFGSAMLFFGAGRPIYEPSISSQAPTIRHGTGSVATRRNTRFFAVPRRVHATWMR